MTDTTTDMLHVQQVGRKIRELPTQANQRALGLVNALLKLHLAVACIEDGNNPVGYINVALSEIEEFLQSTKEENHEDSKIQHD